MIRNVFILIAVCAVATESSALTIPRSRRNVDTCGAPNIKTGLIVNGQNFTRGSFPWTVALMHTETRPTQFFCAATLISKTFVISAARCMFWANARDQFLAREILALFGAHDLSNENESERYQLSPKKIYIHDDWNPRTAGFDADVSLLEFDKGFIQFNDFVQPICVWDSESEPPVTEGVVAGWGKSENASRPHENLPKLVKAVIQSQGDCFLDAKALIDLSSRRTFCAGLRNGSGVCQGDSGGGLFIEVNGVSYLKGIVSSSLLKDENCDVSRNAIYTNVLKFKEWISNIQSLEKVFCTFVIGDDDFSNGPRACKVNQTIDSEKSVLGSKRNIEVDEFNASHKRHIKFLPRHIGDKFPNLRVFYASGCGLTVVREFYFKNLRSLYYLHLDDNQITIIEPKAFNDLVSLNWLFLQGNKIETLDEKLFVKMVKLEHILLKDNKIKSLSPTTFNIPGGELRHVDLYDNFCINGFYVNGFPKYNLHQLEPDLRANCTKSPN